MTVMSIFWILVALVAGVIAFRRKLVSPVPLAVAALLAAAADNLGGGILVSLFVFLLVLVLGRWVIRPALRSSGADETRTRAGAGTLVGRPGVVVERIVNQEAVGCVRIDGEIWTARTWQDGTVIEPGTRVHVVELRGATAVVSE
ncbi:MAG: NfeD family protein [Solirubrobacterales bacterium]|nr:NfeD family protein [Solirubrobacterales bacterium]